MRQHLNSKYLNHGRTPISEIGTYELKITCPFCGRIIRRKYELLDVQKTKVDVVSLPVHRCANSKGQPKINVDFVYYRRIS